MSIYGMSDNSQQKNLSTCFYLLVTFKVDLQLLLLKFISDVPKDVPKTGQLFWHFAIFSDNLYVRESIHCESL